MPWAALAARRLENASICSTLPCTRARFASSESNAPAAASVSSARLLSALVLQRPAKSDRSLNGPLAARSATMLSTACAPMFLSAASE